MDTLPARDAAPEDPPPPGAPRRETSLVLPLWVIFAAWLANGAVYVARAWINNVLSARPLPWVDVVPSIALQSLADVVIWTLYTPLIFAAAARFPLWRGRVPRSLAGHAATGLVLASAYSAATWWIFRQISATSTPFVRWYAFTLYYNLLSYLVVVAVWHAVDYYRRFRDRELRASQLESQLTRARLQALEMQIHPHFLFNTLNSISELMHEDVAAADRMIGRLGSLLRMTTDGAGTQEVTLERELEFLRAYLDIERIRFQDRLSVQLEAEEGALDALVPNMILQPLVENAIRHGFASRSAKGRVTVTAVRSGASLRMEVRDDGAGLSARGVRERVGLRNTRTRLLQLYGEAQRFEVASAPGGGTLALVEIPFRLAPVTREEEAALTR